MSLDKEFLEKYPTWVWKVCRKGHLNSPSAKVCWKCGEEVK